MKKADEQLLTLQTEAPALARCLSPLGRHIVFPQGIPFQARQAANVPLKATIGQVTDGEGAPLPLASMARDLGELDARRSLLYSPQPGHPDIRALWLKRQRDLAGNPDVETSTPFMTHGLTHGISLLADLFCDPYTTVVLPSPHWENYDLLFTLRARARVETFTFFAPDGSFNLDGLTDVLAAVEGKALLVLNFPANPTGWSPTPQQADAIVARVAAHAGPLMVVCDDAYQGVVHEPDLLDHSIFWRLASHLDPERASVVKVDGATKEMLFFAARIGFLTFAVPPGAEEVLTDKLNALVRGSIGSPPGPSQELLRRALQRDATRQEFGDVLSTITGRYQTLKRALANTSDALRPLPFNSAYFALIGLREGLDADTLRRRLIAERGVGTIAVPEMNALRVAYCSTTPDALEHIIQAIDELAQEG